MLLQKTSICTTVWGKMFRGAFLHLSRYSDSCTFCDLQNIFCYHSHYEDTLNVITVPLLYLWGKKWIEKLLGFKEQITSFFKKETNFLFNIFAIIINVPHKAWQSDKYCKLHTHSINLLNCLFLYSYLRCSWQRRVTWSLELGIIQKWWKVKCKVNPRTSRESLVQLYSFFNLGARWGWVVNATSQLFYPQKRDLVNVVWLASANCLKNVLSP
jgi:hypothetical protein